ncbi:hypothetical protein ACJX0J_015134 [Zea mays]
MIPSIFFVFQLHDIKFTCASLIAERKIKEQRSGTSRQLDGCIYMYIFFKQGEKSKNRNDILKSKKEYEKFCFCIVQVQRIYYKEEVNARIASKLVEIAERGGIEIPSASNGGLKEWELI